MGGGDRDEDPIPETRAPQGQSQPTPRPSAAHDATLAAGSQAAVDATMAAGSVPASTTPATSTLPTVTRAHYEILSEYARGGLGRILRAKDKRTGRPVAIKEMLHGTPDIAARFVREALVTANLQHPAIVPVYEVGRWPSGEPFYAMKFVVGKSLEDVIRGATSHVERMAVLPHVIHTCEALAYTHGERIIHRDLKPANVLTGAYGETVVVDWGLAKRLDEVEEAATPGTTSGTRAAAETGGQTMLGSIMGTPAYMPPEQALGDPVDERADVYALGAMLYHCLTGAAPYAGTKTAEQTLARVVAGPPRPVRALAPEVPADLVAIVEKAMARDARDRYPTAKELAVDLGRFQTGQLVSAHEYSWGEVVWRWVKRNRAAVTVAIVLLAAIVVGGIVSVERIVRERDAARADRARAQRAEADEKELQEQQRAKYADLLEEQGRRELLDHQPARAIVYLDKARLLGRDDTDLRFLLARAAPAIDQPAEIVRGHDQAILETSYSPDGSKIVTASLDGAAKIWDAKTARMLASLDGHAKKVVWAAWSPDHTKVATASADGTVKIWSAAGGAPLLTLAHEQPVEHVEWSPDGTRVVTACDDHVARVWDTTTGAQLLELPSREGVTRARWDRDGARILTVGKDTVVRIFDASTGALLREMPGHTLQILCAAWSPDGSRAVTAAQDREVRVWDTRTGRLLHTMKHGDWVYSCSFSPDGGRILTASYDRTAAVWDAATGKLVASMVGHTAYIRAAAWSPDGTLVVTAGDDRTARLWDARTGRIVALLVGHTDTIQAAAFSGDGAHVVTAGDDRVARVWEVKRGVPELVLDGRAAADVEERKRRDAGLLLDLGGHTAGLTGAVFSPDSRLILTASYVDAPVLWDATTGAQLHAFKEQTGGGGRCTFSPDGKRLLTFGSDDETAHIFDMASYAELARFAQPVRIENANFSPDASRVVTAAGPLAVIWDAATGKQLVVCRGHTGVISHAEFSRDGTRIVTVATDGTARVWDAQTGQPLVTMKGLEIQYNLNLAHARFSPDGTRVAVSSSVDAVARLYDAATGALVAELPHRDDVWWVEFSPDGSRILTTSSDKTAKLWDGHTGKPLATLEGHTFWVTLGRFSPDSKLAVTSGEDGTARVWSAETGKLLFSYDLHKDWLGAVIVSPDGAKLASLSGDKTAKVWDLRYETRTPEEIDRLVQARIPWSLDDSRLIPRKLPPP